MYQWYNLKARAWLFFFVTDDIYFLRKKKKKRTHNSLPSIIIDIRKKIVFLKNA